MKNRNRRWLVAWILVLPCLVDATDSGKEIKSVELKEENGFKIVKEPRIFAPRMDYEQWTPLGMGDPLKNDPTYDYVPPVLDRVRYWIEPENRQPDLPISEEPKKTEILLLGVTSKKPSTGLPAATSGEYKSQFNNEDKQVMADSRKDTFDPFLKMVEGPKFNLLNSFHKNNKPHFSMPSYYPSSQYKRTPYTMLVPPPIQTPGDGSLSYSQSEDNSEPSTTNVENKNTTPTPIKHHPKSEITVEHANIIYQSSTYGDQNEFKFSNNQNQFGSLPSASNQVVYKTSKPNLNGSSINFVMRPSGLITVSDFSEKTRNNSGKILTGFSQNGFINTYEESSRTPEIMIKGQVTDADLGLANQYVNIRKPEAQMHSPTGISGIAVDPPKISVAQPPIIMNIRSHSNQISSTNLQNQMKKPPEMGSKTIRPVTLQVLQTMQTMQPPPLPSSSLMKPDVHITPIYTPNDNIRKPDTIMMAITKPEKPLKNSLHSLLSKERPKMDTNTMKPFIPSTFTYLPTTTTTFAPTITTTLIPTTTTEESISMTTDPLFKHYKQPTEPIRGPFYLIIQGHSKVKTYGPTKQFHGINVQETNEIPTNEEKADYMVKHLHHNNLRKEKDSQENNSNISNIRGARSGNLQTLSHIVQTGYGSINFKDLSSNRRLDNNVQETELGVKYEVSSSSLEKSTSEKYHKGIVEAGDMSRKLKDILHA